MGQLFRKKIFNQVKAACKAEYGFTLVEILIAIVILTMIVFAFTPLLVGSIERIQYAGDKSEALYESQSEIEVAIAEKDPLILWAGEALEFIFEDDEGNSTTISVKGDYADVEKSVKEASAWLSGFVPYIPWMQIEPSLIVEGYRSNLDANGMDILITIHGKDDLEGIAISEIDGIYIYDKNNFFVTKILAEDNILIGESGADFSFQLPPGLKTNDTPHIISLAWDEESAETTITYTISTRLYVDLPEALAVSSGQDLLISSDIIETWKFRNKMTGAGELRGATWTGFEYVFIGSSSSGKIGIWREREAPRFISGTSGYGNLNSVVYGGGRLVAVGDDGFIVTSTNATDWSSEVVITADGLSLKAVEWDNNANEFITVGTDGAFFSSSNGIDWVTEDIADPTGVNLHGAAYHGSDWIAVGEKSGDAVIYNSSLNDWDYVTIVESNLNQQLNDVISVSESDETLGINNILIAVGNGGTIITSIDDGQTWESHTPINPDTNSESPITANLRAIDYGYVTTTTGEGENEVVDTTIHFIIVGDNGTIIRGTGSDISKWYLLTGHGITSNISGVAPKWLKE
ncbi:MAG: type II secretion system protein [Bacillota bacterium]|nr:type II secretion system protein [Bacillota bacterium]